MIELPLFSVYKEQVKKENDLEFYKARKEFLENPFGIIDKETLPATNEVFGEQGLNEKRKTFPNQEVLIQEMHLGVLPKYFSNAIEGRTLKTNIDAVYPDCGKLYLEIKGRKNGDSEEIINQ